MASISALISYKFLQRDLFLQCFTTWSAILVAHGRAGINNIDNEAKVELTIYTEKKKS